MGVGWIYVALVLVIGFVIYLAVIVWVTDLLRRRERDLWIQEVLEEVSKETDWRTHCDDK